MAAILKGDKIYHKVRNVSFSPRTDLAGDTVYANELTFEVLTEDSFERMDQIKLIEDTEVVDGQGTVVSEETVFCTYRVAETAQVADGYLSVRAFSVLAHQINYKGFGSIGSLWLSSNVSVEDIIEETVPFDRSIYIDPVLASVPIRGYIPDSSSTRDILQMICMAYGVYVTDSDPDYALAIRTLDTSYVTVPESETFYRPTMRLSDAVDAIDVTYYDYSPAPAGGLERTDDYVVVLSVDGTSSGSLSYYVVRSNVLRVINPDATSLDNVISIDGNTLINSNNVGDVANRLAQYYFSRTVAEFDCINDGKYYLGQRLMVHTGITGVSLVGYAEEIDYHFGLRVRSSIRLVACEQVQVAEVLIRMLWNGVMVYRRAYHLPVGAGYEIELEYPDFTYVGHRYVLRPEIDKVIGVVSEDGNVHDIQATVAIEHYESELYVAQVKEAEEAEGTLTIT